MLKNSRIRPWLTVLCCCGLAAVSLRISVNSDGLFLAPIAQSIMAYIEKNVIQF